MGCSVECPLIRTRLSKQLRLFSQKKTSILPNILHDVVCSKDSHKHLGMVLDKKLNFSHDMKEMISKANKGICLITRLYPCLPKKILVNIYKAFVRPHLDYGDITYDNPSNDTFCH